MTKQKQKKVNLLGALFDVGKHVHDQYEKRHHPNRRKRPKPAGKSQFFSVKRLANNNHSNSGNQMK